MRRGRLQAVDSAIDHNRERRKILLDAIDRRIIEWRYFAVLLRAQPAQPGLARMDHEGLAAGLGHLAHKLLQLGITVTVIDTDPAFDRHRYAHRRAHGCDAVRHQFGLRHQAGAKTPRLHPIGGAADIDVDLPVTPLLADARAFGHLARIAAAELKRQRLLKRIETQQVLAITVHDCGAGYHLGVEQGVPGDQAQEIAAMAIGPLHHGRDAQAPPERIVFQQAFSHG